VNAKQMGKMKSFLILAPLFIYVSSSIAKDNDTPLTLAIVELQALDSYYNANTVDDIRSRPWRTFYGWIPFFGTSHTVYNTLKFVYG
jgi:hypothetical protein